MIAIFANRALGQQSWSGKAFLDGRRWLRGCDHATTADAGVLGPHFLDHMERGGGDLPSLCFAPSAAAAPPIATPSVPPRPPLTPPPPAALPRAPHPSPCPRRRPG